jgi:hypothetical protein
MRGAGVEDGMRERFQLPQGGVRPAIRPGREGPRVMVAATWAPVFRNRAKTKSNVPPDLPGAAIRRTCARCTSDWYFAPTNDGFPRFSPHG